MSNKIKLFTFGDSFTVTFKEHLRGGSLWAGRYVDYIKETPEIYSEIICNHLDLELKNHAIGGSSNYTIFETILENKKYISPQDIIIINWSAINRFRIASQQNYFIDITPNTPHPKQNDDVELITTQEISINRDTYSVFWKEVDLFIKILSEIIPKNEIYHWTWEKPSVDISSNIWSEEDVKHKTVMVAFEWKNVDIDVKNAISRSCDLIVDVTKPFDINEVYRLNKEGKRIFVVNTQMVSPYVTKPIFDKLNCRPYNTINHRKECFKNFIPYYNYETIEQETYGDIKDVHYSRNGHRDLANTFIELLETKKPIV